MFHKPKKSLELKRSFGQALGQNFLKSKNVVWAMVSAGEITDKDTVLEIGPGKGILTEELLGKAKKVIAVEKDSELIIFLKEKFKKEIASQKLILIEGDILKIGNPPDQVFRAGWKLEITTSYKLVANIPYYITGAILKKFLQEEKVQPKKMVLLVQKEVCDRIIARDGKESILSISVKAYGQPKYIQKVPKKYFYPQPKVDSAILFIDNISKNIFIENNITEENFFKIVKIGFAHKRKLLFSNLGVVPPSNCQIPSKSRAENLKLKDWICLTNSLGGRTPK